MSERTGGLWMISFALVLAIWVNEDEKRRTNGSPCRYAYLVFLFWPLVLPCHLVRSRGVEGLVLFLGFVAIYIMPFFVGLVIWTYFVD